jgi:hypothetical protein
MARMLLDRGALPDLDNTPGEANSDQHDKIAAKINSSFIKNKLPLSSNTIAAFFSIHE